MALSNDRIVARGLSPHRHEQEAVDFAIQALPDRDPLRLWALIDLVDSSGRRYDLDLVVIGYHAVYLIEIKSHPAAFSGDVVDWRVDFHAGGTKYMSNPLGLTALKARVLGSMLERKLGPRRPFVQELVFLSDAKVQLKFQGAAANRIVTRGNFERAITFGDFPGASPRLLNSKIDRPLARDTVKALKELGLRESIALRKVNDLVLEDVLLERQSYQDHLARNERLPDLRSRVRTYQVAHGTTEERRQQLLRAAEREARALAALSDHPSILKLKSYVPEGPTGAPCIVFEHFENALPLDAFMRAHPELDLDDRLGLLQRLAEALSYCHRKKVLHRGLAPSAVLVRRDADSGKLELRLFNFQLALTSGAASSGTSHLTHWYGPSEDVYVAPEVLENAANASAASDVFSLGAIAYLVLTGRPPGDGIPERLALMKPGYLSLATARDDLAAGVDATPKENARNLELVMELATAQKSVDRDDNPLSWVESLVDALSKPQVPEAPAFVDPLIARKGDELAPDMLVDAVLGTGSTARALRVRSKEGVFALKVALPEHNERVAREGQVLRALHSDRIVQLFEQREIGGRTCLRMTDAGHTLANVLAEQGAQSLDYARRWGEDLLLALTHLEEQGVQHRDIKPGNLGVLSAEQKKRRHLLLFDFSLASTDATEVRAGTPAYRDPFLAQRGRWDDAADRYATAVTLHELLTGERPRWGEDDVASASDAPITLSAERFDASVRERLLAFFRKALARKLDDRFPTAEVMRTEWLGCFASYVAPAPSVVQAAEQPQPEQSVALPQGLTLESAVEALPLSADAKNALDRAGVLVIRELFALPNNQLSAMAGVGRNTTRKILALIRHPDLGTLRNELAIAERPSDMLVPDYTGPAVAVQFVPNLVPAAVACLRQAGLTDLLAVASTGRARLARILRGHEGALPALESALQTALQSQSERSASSLQAWLERFLPAPQKHGDKPLQHVRALFGLDSVKGQYLDSVAGLAAARGVTRALVHSALSKLREHWSQVPQLAELHEQLDAVLEPSLGMAPLEAAGEALARALGAEGDDSQALSEHALRAGRALVRVAIESHAERKLARVGERLWVVPDALDPRALVKLGELADELAEADPLLSPGAVEERLRTSLAESDADGTLAQVPAHRLVALAALASRRAEKSARLELYPRGLSHVRALDLCVGALPAAKLTTELLQNIVRARYPRAEPLPTGEALRALMDARGYVFDPEGQGFTRKRLRLEQGTEGPLPRAPTTHTSHRGPPDPDAHQFAEDIKVREKRGSFCVLEVAPAYAQQTALELARRLHIKPISLEAVLLGEMRKQVAALGVDAQVVYATDRAGKLSGDWPNLRELMRQAGAAVLANLGTVQEPLVLTEPGLLARYQLDELLRGLVSRTREDDAPAVFLIVPITDEAGGARISHPEGDLTIPLISPAQRLRVPKAWLENLDRARAS
jgi:serine/threonine protein kinase